MVEDQYPVLHQGRLSSAAALRSVMLVGVDRGDDGLNIPALVDQVLHDNGTLLLGNCGGCPFSGHPTNTPTDVLLRNFPTYSRWRVWCASCCLDVSRFFPMHHRPQSSFPMFASR